MAVDFLRFGLFTGATALVLANDVPAGVKFVARIAKRFLGELVQICDGADDEVEMLAAIGALPAGGGRVVLKGHFNIGATVGIPDNTTFEGQGWSTVITLADAVDDHMLANSDQVGGNSNIRIAHLKLEGNKAGQSADYSCINFQKVTGYEIESVWCYQSYAMGITAASDSSYGVIKDCRLEESGKHGISMLSGHSTMITNCVALYSTEAGMNFNYGHRGGVYMNCRAYNCGLGLANAAFSAAESEDCGFVGCTDIGSYLGFNASEQAVRPHFEGCVSREALNHGMRTYADYTRVLGCSVFNPGLDGAGNGLYLNAASHCTIHGNLFIDDQGVHTMGRGIQEYGACDYNSYKGNTVDGYLTEPYRFLGAHDTFDFTIVCPIKLDLSGAAIDEEAFHAIGPSFLAGYNILYTEASSVDAGVDIRVGRYQDGVALDDDYFDVTTSEVSKNLGYALHVHSGQLTNEVIAVGDTLTIGTAGLKVGTGEVMLILQIADLGA